MGEHPNAKHANGTENPYVAWCNISSG